MTSEVTPEVFTRSSPGDWPYLCCFQDGVLKLAVRFPQSRSFCHVQPDGC